MSNNSNPRRSHNPNPRNGPIRNEGAYITREQEEKWKAAHPQGDTMDMLKDRSIGQWTDPWRGNTPPSNQAYMSRQPVNLPDDTLATTTSSTGTDVPTTSRPASSSYSAKYGAGIILPGEDKLVIKSGEAKRSM